MRRRHGQKSTLAAELFATLHAPTPSSPPLTPATPSKEAWSQLGRAGRLKTPRGQKPRDGPRGYQRDALGPPQPRGFDATTPRCRRDRSTVSPQPPYSRLPRHHSSTLSPHFPLGPPPRHRDHSGPIRPKHLTQSRAPPPPPKTRPRPSRRPKTTPSPSRRGPRRSRRRRPRGGRSPA